MLRYSSEDFSNYTINSLVNNLIADKKTFFTFTYKTKASGPMVSQKLVETLGTNEFRHHYYGRNGLVISNTGSGDFIDFYLWYNSAGATLNATGSQEFLDRVKKIFSESFIEHYVQLTWYINAKGDTAELALNTDQLPIKEMYPYIRGNTLEEYYQSYLDSSASILLLIGPPGTGKTTFIKGLINYANSKAMLTFDTEVLNSDGMFSDYIQSDECDFLVLEDSDAFLSARTDGNTMMHKFLNISNGLVSTKQKKMIFSTNLPSIKDIDPALLRPGRCFEVLHFEHLSSEQCEIISEKMGVPFNPDATTLAETFHSAQSNAFKQSFGFNMD